MVISLLTAAVLMLVVFAVLVNIQYRESLNKKSENPQDRRVYEHHYAMIVTDPQNEFWMSVYEGALEEATENDAYVELFGSNLNSEYTEEELMSMAIASGVDGIMLEPDGSTQVGLSIRTASESGIPVVTLLRDVTSSPRVSYVGVSNYNLGQEYSEQIINIIKSKNIESETWNVMVLMDSSRDDSLQSILFTTIQEAINSKEEIASTVHLEARSIENGSTFETEEAIRSLFLEDELPDIMLCLDETSSACVYQAIVDYNQVGNVELIGYYTDKTLLSGISKDIIHSTAGVDTYSMGSSAVKALNNYITTGYSSDYYSVDTYIIDGSNVAEYMEDDENE